MNKSLIASILKKADNGESAKDIAKNLNSFRKTIREEQIFNKMIVLGIIKSEKARIKAEAEKEVLEKAIKEKEIKERKTRIIPYRTNSREEVEVKQLYRLTFVAMW